MGILKNLLKKKSEDSEDFKRKFKEAEMNMKIQRRLEEREKSSNERELESYMKRKREEQIKKHLDKIHDKQNKEMWKGSYDIMKQDKSMLNNDKPILKDNKKLFGKGNIFLDKKSNNPMTQRRMFFK